LKLLHDLRRRRIFRLTGIYLVAAWLVIEVASVLFPAWGIPDSALRYLVIAAVLCFPIALAFGWIYDITGDGIVRTQDAAPGEDIDLSLKRADYLTLTMLFIAGAFVVFGSAVKIADEITVTVVDDPSTAKIDNSVAVMPFVNLDSNPDTRYFSDGITEEILHRLSTIKPLHILSQTSSFAFRGSTDGSAKISDLLGVRFLLHGSVRRDGNFVRVTSRLVDETGFQIWSQTFDRELDGIFVIQSEIASSVASQVVKQIVPMEQLPDGRTTENMDAYDAYLIGKAFQNARTPGWQNQAADAFNDAIRLDPNYAPPYAGLAVALTVGRSTYEDDRPNGSLSALKAIELDPELAEGHAALGLVLFAGQEPDLLKSTISLRRALELDPSISIVYNWLASALSEQGLSAESEAIQDQGLSIDPLNPSLSVNIANRYLRLGNLDRAEQLMLRLTLLPEPPGLAYWELLSLYTDVGQYDEAARWNKELIREYYNTNNAQTFAAMSWTYERLGMTGDADYWMAEFTKRVRNPVQNFVMRSYLWKMRGDTDTMRDELKQAQSIPGLDLSSLASFPAAVFAASHINSGQYEKGIEIFERAFDIPELSILSELGSMAAYEFMHTLAFGYQSAGRDEDAVELLENLDSSLSKLVDNSSMRYGPVFEALALNRALKQDYAGALDYLALAKDVGWGNYQWISTDPSWMNAAAEAEISTFLAEVFVELETQRNAVNATDAEHDFRAEIAALANEAHPE
jgi:TolB-like protein/tetratricopeptide (TPR) repeat protein